MHEDRFMDSYSSNNLGAAGTTIPAEVSPATEHALKLGLPCLHCFFNV